MKGWEYNVWADIPSSQATFSAPFLSMTITPLDTCGAVQLRGTDYERVKTSSAPLARAIMQNYRIWWPRFGAGGPLAATKSCEPANHRSVEGTLVGKLCAALISSEWWCGCLAWMP